MSNITLFDQELPDFLQSAGTSALTQQLAGKAGVKRIVPKNGIFRKTVSGKEMGKIKGGTMNAIVINASPQVGRIFYAKAWTPDAEPTSPDCFSNDGRTPDKNADAPQAERCDSCAQNIKGSGMGSSKACRYSRRIALVLEEDFGTSLEGDVYQMNLASKSLFGDKVGDNSYPFEGYTKYLSNNGKSLDYVVTELSFNDNQSVLFSPVRFITKAEYAVTSAAAVTPETQRMVVMTPYQADVSGSAKPLAVSAPVSVALPQDSPIEEPVKREKKVEPKPTLKKDLDSVVKAWSDED